MLVRDLLALLALEHPDSPVTVDGLCSHGAPVFETNLFIDRDQGPTPDIDEVNISWISTPEVERLWEADQEASRGQVRRLP